MPQKKACQEKNEDFLKKMMLIGELPRKD